MQFSWRRRRRRRRIDDVMGCANLVILWLPQKHVHIYSEREPSYLSWTVTIPDGANEFQRVPSSQILLYQDDEILLLRPRFYAFVLRFHCPLWNLICLCSFCFGSWPILQNAGCLWYRVVHIIVCLSLNFAKLHCPIWRTTVVALRSLKTGENPLLASALVPIIQNNNFAFYVQFLLLCLLHENPSVM